MMGTGDFTDDFKRDAVAQITERGYPVSEVSERLGVSKHSLYAWKRKFAKTASGESEKDAEIRLLDLQRFCSGLLRAMLSSKETGYGSDTQRRVQA